MTSGFMSAAAPLDSDDLLTETEAAPILRVSVSWLQKCRGAKRGPRFVRVGGRCLYSRADLKRFIERNTVATEDDPAPPLRRIK